MSLLKEIVGFGGLLLMLAAYSLLKTGVVAVSSIPYRSMVAIGAMCVFLVLPDLKQSNSEFGGHGPTIIDSIPLSVLFILWGLVSIAAFFGLWQQKSWWR